MNEKYFYISKFNIINPIQKNSKLYILIYINLISKFKIGFVPNKCSITK